MNHVEKHRVETMGNESTCQTIMVQSLVQQKHTEERLMIFVPVVCVWRGYVGYGFHREVTGVTDKGKV